MATLISRSKMRLSKLLNILLVFQLFFCYSSAWGIPTGCKDKIFKCQCGPNSGNIVDISVLACTFIHRWKTYCHACKDGDRIDESDVCPRYKQCQECQPDGNSCSVCPDGKTGTWCERAAAPQPTSPSGVNWYLRVPGGSEVPNNPVCQCLNGGVCQGINNACICPHGFQGTLCEKRTGCPNITLPPFVSAVRIPESAPLYMEFSCPRSGYMIEGSTRLTCIEDQSQWSHSPPTCVIACKLPTSPDNGRLDLPLEEELVKLGTSVDFLCNDGFVLIGASKTTCMSDTNWSHPSPYCANVTYCKEPEVLHATYQLQGPPFQPAFTNGTHLIFKCTGDHLLMGQAQITCGDDGSWSSKGPTCVKVFGSKVDCETSGAEVVDKIGTPVRIHCPPGCSTSKSSVLGTVIYEETSAVCKAAVHSGRISNNLGGSLFLVNNGPYNDFLGSTMKDITSERKEGLSNSFRFHHDPALEAQNKDDPFKGCPEGWMDIKGHCVYVVAKLRAWDVAKGICTNMGSRLPVLKDDEFLREVLRRVRPQTDAQRFWLSSKSSTNESLIPLWDETNEELELNPNISLYDEEETLDDNFQCTVLSQLQKGPVLEVIPCAEEASFMCDINMKELQVSCEDPGLIANGFYELQDPLRKLLRGAVLNFKCNKLHFLKGEPTLHCLANGTWSSSKPHCIKVPACVSPPNIKSGSFVTIAPSTSFRTSRLGGPKATGYRDSRLGVFRPPKSKRSVRVTTSVKLPSGHYHVGTRAYYTCQSRYYDLVGSQFRKCQADGTWTGIPVTCLPICGRSDSPRTPFIINGTSSELGQWPWQVGISLFMKEYNINHLRCGGSLINEEWILTAAHCIRNETTQHALPHEQFRLFAGKYYRDDKLDDDFVQMRRAVEIHEHPAYDSRVFDADIALIRLDHPVTFTARVQPVCLPTDRSTRLNMVDGKKGVVVGWGLTEDSEYADTLKHAVLPVVSHEKCQAGYEKSGIPLTVSENMYCAGMESGMKDTCGGDSGGPMVFPDETWSRTFWVQEGIVSWGSEKGCGNSDQYSGFTKIHRFLDWINHYV